MPSPRYRGRGYLEGERHDELSDGAPNPVQREASQERRGGGKGIAPGSKIVPAMGGRARKGRAKLTHEVAPGLPVSEALKRRAKYARRKVCGELAANHGAGVCGVIASLMAKLGVEDAAMREAALDAGDIDLARKLGESARMHLVYARAEAIKDAEGRTKAGITGTNGLPLGFVYVDDAEAKK